MFQIYKCKAFKDFLRGFPADCKATAFLAYLNDFSKVTVNECIKQPKVTSGTQDGPLLSICMPIEPFKQKLYQQMEFYYISSQKTDITSGLLANT